MTTPANRNGNEMIDDDANTEGDAIMPDDDDVETSQQNMWEDDPEQNNKYNKAMFLSTQQSFDPPLVAATPLHSASYPEEGNHQHQHEHHQSSSSIVVQAVAVTDVDDMLPVATVAAAAAAIDEEEEEDPNLEGAIPTVASSLTVAPSSQEQEPQPTQQLQQQQQHDSRRVELVQIDESTSFQIEPPNQEQEKKNTFCRQHWILIICLSACILIGLAVGLSITLTGISSNNDKDKSTMNQVPATSTASPTTNMPTASPHPTYSPSCINTWQPTKQQALFRNGNSNNDTTMTTNALYAVSPDGSTAIASYTKAKHDIWKDGNDTQAFYAMTLNLASLTAKANTIQTSIQSHYRFSVVATAFSMDGSRLLIGGSNAWNNDGGAIIDNNGAPVTELEIGGSVWVLQRIYREDYIVWLPLYCHFSGGGKRGAVFQVATAQGGTLHAIVAGSYDNIIQTHIQVYQQRDTSVTRGAALMKDTELVPIGQRLVENAMTEHTLIGLSESGERLVVYNTDGRLRIFDYDPSVNEWQITGEEDVSRTYPERASLEVSQDGQTLAVFDSGGGDLSGSTHILQFNKTSQEWSKTVIFHAPLSYGSLSTDGRTMVSAAGQGNSIMANVYQQVNGDWRKLDTVLLNQMPNTGPDVDLLDSLMGVSVDASGRQLVLVTTQMMHVFERICTDQVGTVGDTLAPTPTQAPTCFDSFGNAEFLHNLTEGDPFDTKPPVDGVSTESTIKPEFNETNSTGAAVIGLEESSTTDDDFVLDRGDPTDDAELLEDIREALFNTLNASGSFADDKITQMLDQADLTLFFETSYEKLSVDEILAILSIDENLVGWPVANGYAVSSDGSILALFGHDIMAGMDFVDTYDMTNSSATKQRLLLDSILAIALSGNGQRLVVGAGSTASLEDSFAFQAGGTFSIYRLETGPNGKDEWIFELVLDIGGGITGAVSSVSISYDGNVVAFVASAANATGFVSAYSFLEGGAFISLGSTLREDLGTTVGIVNSRLFVSGSDGTARTYDLIDNVWKQVGQRINKNYGASMVLAPLNDAVLGIFASYDSVDVNEYQDPYWLPVDTSSVYGNISAGENVIAVTMSPDGDEIMLVETTNYSDPNRRALIYTGKIYSRRAGDNVYAYQFIQEIPMGELNGIITMTHLTTSGDFVVVTNRDVVIYRRASCQM